MIPRWAITGAVAAAVAGAAGFGLAWELQAGKHAKYLHAQEVNARATERLRRQNSETAATGFEKQRIVIREKFVPITEEIERVVTKIEYRDRMCLDPDGVRVANRALQGLTDNPGQPGPALPASAPPP